MWRRRGLPPAAGSTLLLLVAALLATAGVAVGRPQAGGSGGVGPTEARRRLAEEQPPADGEVPAAFTITNATLLQFLKRAVTPGENAVIFTTVR